MPRDRIVNALKVALALVAISAVVSLPLRDAAAGGPPFLAAIALVLGVGIAVTAVAIASLTVWQAVLRAGGTDVQWLAFPGDPPGLEQLRAEAREAERAERTPRA